MTPDEIAVRALPLLSILSAACLALVWAQLRGLLPGFALAPARDRREPPLWSWPEVLLGVFLFLSTSIVFGGLFAPLKASGAMGEAACNFAIAFAASAVTTGAVLSLITRHLGQSPRTLGLAPCPITNVGAVLLLYVLTLLPIGLVSVLWRLFLLRLLERDAEPQGVVELVRRTIEGGGGVELGLLIALAVVVAPFTEEILFRGLVLGWLRARAGAWAAALGSSAAFAAAHFTLGVLMPLFILGLLLAAIAVRTRSLYPTMLFHAVFNAVSIARLL